MRPPSKPIQTSESTGTNWSRWINGGHRPPIPPLAFAGENPHSVRMNQLAPHPAPATVPPPDSHGQGTGADAVTVTETQHGAPTAPAVLASTPLPSSVS